MQQQLDRNILVRRAWTAIILLSGIAILVISLLGFFGRWAWSFELASHFRLQYFVAALALGLLAILTRRWRSLLLVGASLAINGFTLLPYLPMASRTVDSEASVRLLVINAYVGNQTPKRIVDYVTDSDADLVFVSELTKPVAEALERLRDRYPYTCTDARNHPSGLGLFSRLPLRESRIETLEGEGWPSLVAETDVAGAPLTIVGTHPVPPASPGLATMRNRQLEAIRSFALEQDGALIVSGDLNITTWSPIFERFIEGTRLVDTRLGRGVQGSWPTDRPWMRIAIDHVLVTPEIHVLDRRLGPDIGSDHFPILVDLSIPGRNDTRISDATSDIHH